MFRSAEVSVGSPGTDADVKAFFESLQVRQEDSRAVLSAILPTDSSSQVGGIAGTNVGTRNAAGVDSA